MNLPFYLDVQTIILLKLANYFLSSFTHHQLHSIFISVRSISIPCYVFDQVVLRNIYSSTSETQPDDKAFSCNFLLAVVEVHVHETLNYKLLQFFVSSSSLVYQLDLFLELSNVLRSEALVVDAFFKLLVHDLVGEPSDWRSEMSIEVKTESKVSFINVEMSGIDSILLDMHGLIE